MADDHRESPLRHAGQCTTMAEVRAEIDRIDRQLVRILAERQSYMDAAARIKADRRTVRDEARIRDVLEKVKAAASGEGLAWTIAEPVWRELMERCIAYEFEAFDALRKPVSASS